MPATATNKVLKRRLVKQGATTCDGVLRVREERGRAYAVGDDAAPAQGLKQVAPLEVRLSANSLQSVEGPRKQRPEKSPPPLVNWNTFHLAWTGVQSN